MSRGIFQVKFCLNYKTGYLHLNIDQLPCKFLIQFLDSKLQYSLSRFQRRYCGMRDESKNGCGTQDGKPRITQGTRRTFTPIRRDRDEHPEWGGIAELIPKYWRDAGFKKLFCTHLCRFTFLDELFLDEPRFISCDNV